MRRATAMMAGSLTLAAACWLLLEGTSAAGGKGGLPAEVISDLIQQDAKLIQDALADDKLDKKSNRRVWTGAFLVATYAQAGMKGAANPKELAAVRDTALELFKQAKGNNTAEAKKLAGMLAPGKATGGDKADPVAFETILKLHDVMHHFEPLGSGGFGGEKELGDLEEKKGLDEADLKRLVYLGHKIAAVGHLAESFAGEYVDAKDKSKTEASWKRLCEGLQSSSLAVAEAAKKKDAAGTAAALKKLNESCTKCHDIFR